MGMLFVSMTGPACLKTVPDKSVLRSPEPRSACVMLLVVSNLTYGRNDIRVWVLNGMDKHQG